MGGFAARQAVSLVVLVSFLTVFSPTMVLAKGCMTGSCHQELTKVQYIHGPVAAEMAGVKACEMCHVAVAGKCTATKGGKFKLKSQTICQTCHSKGTGSQHSEAGIATKCLKCHSPHGSDYSPQMLRPGVKSSRK